MSAINLDAALETFFEEAADMLEQLEQSVLELEEKPKDIEELNALFRCAHTIKGSAGLFGLNAVVAFTHHVETVLDALRNGEIALDLSLSSLLFDCRDHITLLLDHARAGSPPQADGQAQEHTLVARLLALVEPGAQTGAGGAVSADGAVADAAVADDKARRRWRIQARFGANTFRDGFDPLSIIAYLASLGDLVAVQPELAPALEFATVDPETCHLAFEILLDTDAGHAAILGAFQFVMEDCELTLEPVAPAAGRAMAVTGEPGDRLGDLLLDTGVLTPDDLARALELQKAGKPPRPIGEILVETQVAPQRVVDAAVARQARIRDGRSEEQRMVRIPAEKLDQLINLVGELVIAGAGAHSLAQDHKAAALVKSTKKVNSLVEEVRNGALSMRMVQIGETFGRFRRVVRDVCGDLGKQVDLELIGSESELDKSVVDKIVDPLMHIVRNSLDHGIEMPAARIAAGKSPTGRLVMSAFHDCGQVVIQITDDGRGLDRERILAKAIERGIVQPGAALSEKEIFGLVFAPGFSTAEAVTNLSGRGVGMDVVRRNIESLRGTVSLRSDAGQGTTVEIRLPLTLAIIDGFLVRVGRSHLVLPLDVVAECINTDSLREPFEGASTGFMPLRGSVLPVVFLRNLFKLRGPQGARQSIIVVRSGGRQAGIVVDALAGEYQTVIKPLGRMFRHLKGISGSTILGSGEVALILDIAALVGLAAQADEQSCAALSPSVSAPVSSSVSSSLSSSLSLSAAA